MVIMSFMVLGVVSMTRLGIDLFPDVNFPFVNVIVVYPGASPEEVETLVTRPIEDAVAGINGVKRVISSSTESRANVGLELRLEVDPQAAAAEVREKVAAIRSRLPEQIEDPTIVRFDVAALPIILIVLTYDNSSPLPPVVTAVWLAVVFLMWGELHGIIYSRLAQPLDVTATADPSKLDYVPPMMRTEPGGGGALRTGVTRRF